MDTAGLLAAAFPELAAHRTTCTRLHPEPGTPGAYDSHVGGPFLWPADEEWPVCASGHPAPVPLVAVAQLFTRDVPSLPAPEGRDVLQVLWCPLETHGTLGLRAAQVRWRTAADCTPRPLPPPASEPAGHEGAVPRPCVLRVEPGVVDHTWFELLPPGLRDRIEEWEEDLWERHEETAGDGDEPPDPPSYDDLAVHGWKAGGHPTWSVTGPTDVVCACGTPMTLLLAIGSDRATEVVVANHGTLNVFTCPADGTHDARSHLG